MKQLKLMQLVAAMPPGTAQVVQRVELVEAAEGNKRSIFDGHVNEADLREFISQIENNWGLRLTQDPLKGSYTLYKLTETETRMRDAR